MNEFRKFGLSEILIDYLNKRNITKPTEIQTEVIPKILSGEDVIAQSKTGTGKTLAYLLPIIEMLQKQKTSILIIAPTKELARQIYTEAVYFTEKLDIKTELAIAGESIENQSKKIKEGFNILIGVPGRIIKLTESGILKLGLIKKIILDETDFLIDLGFLSDIKNIFQYAKNINQLLIFSATLSSKTKKIIDIIHNQRYAVRVDSKNSIPENIKNFFIPIKDEEREITLYKIIKIINPYLAIIFVRTKEISIYLYNRLKEKNIAVSIINGSLSPSERKKNIKEFSSAKTQYLIATDLASRGLDIPGITHIINYNQPVNELDYLHRAGRTGRMGEEGAVYSLCNELDEGYLKKYAYNLGFTLTCVKIKNNEIVIDKNYIGVKPRFNLNELKKKQKIERKKGAKDDKKARRSKKRR